MVDRNGNGWRLVDFIIRGASAIIAAIGVAVAWILGRRKLGDKDSRKG